MLLGYVFWFLSWSLFSIFNCNFSLCNWCQFYVKWKQVNLRICCIVQGNLCRFHLMRDWRRLFSYALPTLIPSSSSTSQSLFSWQYLWLDSFLAGFLCPLLRYYATILYFVHSHSWYILSSTFLSILGSICRICILSVKILSYKDHGMRAQYHSNTNFINPR